MRERLAVCTSICALAALLCASEQVIAACRSALLLCSRMLIPSLFPFFVLSLLMNKLGVPRILGNFFSPLAKKLWKVTGAGSTAFLMGLCGGYPLGAAYIADMHRNEAISTEEGERLLAFCNNSGPAFLIGVIGCGIFHSAQAGVFLYGIHALSALLCGLILRIGVYAPEASCAPSPPPLLSISQAFPLAVKEAVISTLQVCGFVTCFTVLVGLLDADGFFSLLIGSLSCRTGAELHWMRAFLTGMLELGSGAGAMAGLNLMPINLALSSFLMGWGGISVHFQSMAVIAESGLQGRYHTAGRLICASLGAFLSYFLSRPLLGI